MPASLLATVTLESTNGIVRDNAVNTFALDTFNQLPTAGEASTIADQLAGFYNTVQPVGNSVANFIGPSRSRAASKLVVRLYNITGKLQRVRTVDSKGRDVWRTPLIGSPIASFGRTLGAIGNVPDALPSEVACVLSLRTAFRDTVQTEVEDQDDDDARDRPKARQTGRIFIGPLTRQALGQEVDGERRVEANFRTALTTAANQLKDGLDAVPGGWSWSVWSRADGELRSIDNVVVDNAFDTIRKRGQKATASTALSITG